MNPDEESDLRKIFAMDQAIVDWKPIAEMFLNLIREAKACGATPQEAQLLIAGTWQGFLAHSKGQNEGAP